MKTIAFIPVRAGSKSIPLKNIKSICGKPLVYWTLQAAEQSQHIDEVVCATDSDQIKEIVHSFGFSKVNVYDRSAENAQDQSSTESVMLEYIHAKSIADDTRFILIQATSPLLNTQDLDKGIDMLDTGHYDSILSCVRIKHFFWNEDGTAINYNYKSRPRRQDFDGMMQENGAFYINSVGNILKDNNRLSGRIGISEMEAYTSLEIDEEDDWIVAEKLMRKYVQTPHNLKDLDIKWVITDIDGVWTDGGMFYDNFDNEFKKFNVADGWGVKFLKDKNIPLSIMTGENVNIVKRRAEKLKIEDYHLGVKDKLSLAKKICQERGITLHNIAFLGDDINDLPLLKEVGFSATPQQAPTYVKDQVHLVMNKKGGDGVFREFVEYILKHVIQD